ncbi:CHAT domain-containing protein, partial [Paludisphaera mucosa]
KAEALSEAKAWLRGLTKEDAGRALTGLPRSLGSRPEPLPEPPGRTGSEHPYDHPYFWAAFVLVGAPD